jgi:hypothetical protein
MTTEYQFVAVELDDRSRWVSTHEARYKLPTRPSPATFYRWRTKGRLVGERLVFLPTFTFCGRYYTTLDAFRWFQRQQMDQA